MNAVRDTYKQIIEDIKEAYEHPIHPDEPTEVPRMQSAEDTLSSLIETRILTQCHNMIKSHEVHNSQMRDFTKQNFELLSSRMTRLEQHHLLA